MNIAVDATTWGNPRGYGRFVRALLSNLVEIDSENTYNFVTDDPECKESIPTNASKLIVRTSRSTVSAAGAESARSPMDMYRMSRALMDPSFDLLLFPTVYSYVPVFNSVKKVVMIYDVIAEKFPELTTPGYREQFFWKLKVFLGRKQADAIVTISEFSREGIAEYFEIDREDIYVVNGACDPVFRMLDNPPFPAYLEERGLSRSNRLIAYVGGFGPHKNVSALVEAFLEISHKEEFEDVFLILVGEYEQETYFSTYPALVAQIKELDLENRIIFTGFIPDDDLVVLLNHSTTLVLPSLIEGLGLPAVEAAACGCPVIATSESPLPELLGEAGIYIDPGKPEQITKALIDVLGNESRRKEMASHSIPVSEELNWQTSARMMKSIIEKVVVD